MLTDFDTPPLAPPAPWVEWLKDATSGGVGAIFLVYAGNPLDRVKIRMQTEVSVPGAAEVGPLRTMASIVAEEGVLSMWRGATPAMASAMRA